MATKREMRIKRHLHKLHKYGQSSQGGMSWARKQAARRANRRRKSEKSGYTREPPDPGGGRGGAPNFLNGALALFFLLCINQKGWPQSGDPGARRRFHRPDEVRRR